MLTKKLAIVILSYNTKDLLSNCLNSLFKVIDKSKEKNLEVWVVDNGSKDGTVEMIKKLGKSNSCLKVLLNSENFGFAKGNNIGIKKAIKNGAEYVLILNSDTEVEDNFWQPLVDFLGKNEKAGVVTPKIYFAPGYEYHKSRYKKAERGKVIWAAGGTVDWDNVYGINRGVNKIDKGQFKTSAKVDFASGCCLLASSDTWEKVNFFDERYFMYYEDNDFCQKVIESGKLIYYVPEAKIWHLNSGSSRVGGELQDYFIIRNRLIFGLRWAKPRTKFALIREALRLFLSGRKWQKIAVKDYFLGNFEIGSWKKS